MINVVWLKQFYKHLISNGFISEKLFESFVIHVYFPGL